MALLQIVIGFLGLIAVSLVMLLPLLVVMLLCVCFDPIHNPPRSRRKRPHPLVVLPADAPSADWETAALDHLRHARELSAIELVQRHTQLDFEAAKLKLYKLDEQPPQQ